MLKNKALGVLLHIIGAPFFANLVGKVALV